VTAPPPLPPRGWYPDPGGSASWRWWDGARWTDDLEPFARPAAPSTTPLLEREAHAAGRLVPLGLVLLAVAVLIASLVRSFETTYYLATWHWFRHAYALARHGASTAGAGPPPNAPAGARLASIVLVLPAQILGLFLVLSFQHRAATAAKAVGIPQRLSPRFGVIGWFIPLANLVLPWMAWRDLLPAGHPRRASVTTVWLLGLGSGLASLAAVGATITSTTLAGLCSGASVLLAIIALRKVPDIVTEVGEAHAASRGSADRTVHDLPDAL